MLNVCDIQVMKPLLAQHGFHFSKAKGQNFLIAPWVPSSIAQESGVDETAGVLEIGPGIGPLTQQLCLRAGKVCAVEVDTRLEPILKQTAGDFSNLEILWGDILKQDIPALVAEKFPGLRPMACANLPYYITTPVLMRLLESELPIERLVVMVQLEAAKRLCAPLGTRDCGAVSAAVEYYTQAEILFEVGRESFYPSPNVDSAVIALTRRQQPPVQVTDEGYFFRVVKGAFLQRRKTLANSLNAALGVPKAELTALFQSLGLSATARAEQLTMSQMAALANALYEKKA